MSTISAIMRAKIYREIKECNNEDNKNKTRVTLSDMQSKDRLATKNRQ